MKEREQQIADLERQLKFKDDRIDELKDELDRAHDLVRRLEDHAKENEEYLENFILAFGLTQDDDGKWRNGELIQAFRELSDTNSDLRRRHNKLVGIINRNLASLLPVGRPIAASDHQQNQIMKHHKVGKSSRWIAEELNLSRRTVTTVIGRAEGRDRTTVHRRQRLGLERPVKDWRIAARERLPNAATKHLDKGRKLRQEAKGLR